jgi:hypothetical protein
MIHTDQIPDSEHQSPVDSASTWMQVVFGGLSVTIAIVALVIGYFAWLEPHSPDDNTGQATNATAATSSTGAGKVPAPVEPTVDGRRVPLADLTPSVGGSNLRRSGSDLTMPCASGEAADRHRAVEYDLAGRYLAMAGELTVSKAPDPDSSLQMKIFIDGRQAEDVILTEGKPATVDVRLAGVQNLRMQLTCQSRDSAMTIGAPSLTHA